MNQNKLIFIVPITLILFGIIGVGYYLVNTGETEVKQKRVHYNLLVLLDLSDRVLRPRQVEKDTATINYLVDFIEDDAKKNFFINSCNSFNIIIAPQTTSNEIGNVIYRISKSLTIQLDEVSVTGNKKRELEEFKVKLSPTLSELYLYAIKNTNFVGADIWSFFKNDLKERIQQPQNQNDSIRNVLVILTDGYLNFSPEVEKIRETEGFRTSYMNKKFRNNPKWREKFFRENHGLIPVGKDFGNLEVLVVEINPLFPNQTSELDMIKTYWEQWFTEMNIKRFKTYKTENDLPLIKQRLDDFLK